MIIGTKFQGALVWCKEAMTFLFISGEIVILTNFKWVLGEKEESSLPAHDH